MRILVIPCAILLLAAACQSAPPAVDLAATEKAVGELFNAYGQATKDKDVPGVAAALDDNGLFLGTDPKEFWDKQTIIGEFQRMVSDTSVHLDFILERRDIRISPDGQSALVIEQCTVPFLSKRVATRNIGHAKAVNGKWIIDF